MSGALTSDILGSTLFADPGALVVGLVAVMLVGLSDGGLGVRFGLMAVPVLSLVMLPVQAALLRPAA